MRSKLLDGARDALAFVRGEIPAKVTFFPEPGVQQTRRVMILPDGSVLDVDTSEILGPEFFMARPRIEKQL